MTNSTLATLFTAPHCSDLVRQQELICIDSEDTVEHGCEVLIRHGISSAPVFDRRTQTYVGMFDYRDIVDYVLVVFKRKQLPSDLVAESAKEGGEQGGSSGSAEDGAHGATAIRDIVRKAMTGEPVRIHFAADLSRKNPFYAVPPQAPLVEAVQVLAGAQAVHRVNVVEPSKGTTTSTTAAAAAATTSSGAPPAPAAGRIVGVLSQTDVVRYITSKSAQLEEICSKTLRELQLCHAPVISISGDATVMEALSRMSEYGISSVAVVDGNSCLIGNISMADIKYIFKYARYTRLWSTCAQFISVVLAQQGLENGGKDRFPVFDVSLDSTIGFAMRKIIATRVHRVWVVDENKRLVGIVSLTDIIRIFYQHSQMAGGKKQ